MYDIYSWTIAIKSLFAGANLENTSGTNGSASISGYSGNYSDDGEDLSLLMDEAKTMMKVGSYHENIVNLQGITAKLGDGMISEVSLLEVHIYLYIYMKFAVKKIFIP